MILTSTTEATKFQVPWRLDDPEAPVFRIRSSSVIERGQMEAELSGELDAGRVGPWELNAAIQKGVMTLFADDPDLDRILAVVTAEAAGDKESLSEDDKALLEEVGKLLAKHWPEYRDLLARSQRRRELAPIVALRRFCVGIEGVGINGKPIEFARGKDGMVAEATLASLDPLELIVAGNHAYGLQYGRGESAEKNSPPPTASDDAPPISPSVEPSKGAGRSKAKGGKKTPA